MPSINVYAQFKQIMLYLLYFFSTIFHVRTDFYTFNICNILKYLTSVQSYKKAME